MPNWALNDQVKSFLRNRARHLAQRAMDYAVADFPLDNETLQMAAMPRESVMTMRSLAAEDVSLPSYNQVRFGFLREQLPGLTRGATVVLTMPMNIYLARMPNTYARSIKFWRGSSDFVRLDFDREPLDPEQSEALVAWLNRAVRQKRLSEIVNHAAGGVLETYAKTCAHLHRMWPMLATLINDTEGTGIRPHASGERLFWDTWKDRLHARHRPLALYDPDPMIMRELGPLIRAADTVLTSGMLLAPYVPEPGTVGAVLDFWEALPTDKTYV